MPIPGTVQVTAPIAPTDPTDIFPTHLAEYGKGSLRTVADLTARDAIAVDRREEGMLCFVIADGTMYQLVGGIDNANWQVYGSTSPLGHIMDQQAVTPYNPAQAITGTVRADTGLYRVLGTGTFFLTELAPGDRVKIDGTYGIVDVIIDDDQMRLLDPFDHNVIGVPLYKMGTKGTVWVYDSVPNTLYFTDSFGRDNLVAGDGYGGWWRQEPTSVLNPDPGIMDVGVPALRIRRLATQQAVLDVMGSVAFLALPISVDDYTISDNLGSNDFTLLCDAALNEILITLPNAATNQGRILVIKKIDATANRVRVVPQGVSKIDGQDYWVTSLQYESVMLQTDGTHWYIIA